MVVLTTLFATGWVVFPFNAGSQPEVKHKAAKAAKMIKNFDNDIAIP